MWKLYYQGKSLYFFLSRQINVNKIGKKIVVISPANKLQIKKENTVNDSICNSYEKDLLNNEVKINLK